MGDDSVETVKILLVAKSDVEQIDQENVIPIVLTVSHDCTNLINILVNNGEEPYNFRRQDGKGLLANVITRGKIDELHQALKLTSPPLLHMMEFPWNLL